MPSSPTLTLIAALVRAGAVDRASELFAAGGHAARTADPAALALNGRIAKARARLAAAADQPPLFAAAAAAYRAAHALAPAPYLAINAASLSLLGGDAATARHDAEAVLALLGASPPPADTPYFLAATRAEALLLLGDRAGAEAALAKAVYHDHDGWDDRAATLTQLREVLTAQGQADDWLGAYAPPASLHFAGHMGLRAGGDSEIRLRAALDDWLGRQRIGFAWGALAAGADIVIAEGLLAAGAAVHLVLPCPVDRFTAQSVAPAGPDWVTRFETVLDQANSLRVAAETAASVHDPLATAFAGELAIGGAMLNAARMGTAAIQLVVLDEAGGGRNTARQAALWHGPAGSQVLLTAPRDAAVDALFPAESPDPARHLLFHAAIGFDRDEAGLRDSARLTIRATRVAACLAAMPVDVVRAAADEWEIATPDFAAGLAAVTALAPACREAGFEPPTIGCDLAMGQLIPDPASGGLVPYGPGRQLARRLMAMAPPGLVLTSDALAVTLAARAPGSLRTEPWLPDEPGFGGAIHSARHRS